MSIREDIELYTKLSGEDGSQETIATIGAYLRGYRQGKEDAEPHWIPVTERLPENDEDVLVQMDDDSMMVDFRSASSNGWFWAEIGDEPLAWMPLPEAFKG